MMNNNFMECRTLPAINETFPLQFNRPISILSPLDLSLRASGIIPITPPSTPSPPRKRHRLMSDENYLWRPHVMETATAGTPQRATTTAEIGSYFGSLTYTSGDVVERKNKNNYVLEVNNLEEIPQSHKAAITTLPQEQQQQHNNCATIYVDDDDETILLTEDEDETLVSSHDYTADGDDDDEEELEDDVDDDCVAEETAEEEARSTESNDADHGKHDSAQHVAEEEEYVDILSNDDDEVSPLSTTALLRLQSQAAAESALESSGRVLTRTKLIYEDKELHNQAVDGLAKLFERDFPPKENEDKTEKTYTDLTTRRSMCLEVDTTRPTPQQQEQQLNSQPAPAPTRTNNHHKTYKTGERKRMKLRKHLSALDEDTISPVSGTIIRKLRDDEELVVRKGDIDPAFNVVEITEEAKAILASIDNKIGAYLCQLCRTLYDDAFQLAQHRCPRIVHIEYKCSECEKVFNCPANLASHRRWHKPKSELLANGSKKQRHAAESLTTNSIASHDKQLGHDTNADNTEGIFPCQQCGKTFRRHAYLKKHLASHQMLDNLKSLDIFKNCSSMPNFRNVPPYQPAAFRAAANAHLPASNTAAASAQPHAALYHANQVANATGALNHQHHHAAKVFPQRFGTFPFPPPFDQRRFYSLEDLYLSQHLERNSAFQYVQATHLRNMSAATNGSAATANNFLARPVVPSLISMPVK